MRVVFMGTPDFAIPTLMDLVGQGHEVVAAYTRPPAQAGRRGLDLRPSPVQVAAERFGVPVLTPRSLKDEGAARIFEAHDAEVAVVVAYGLILPRRVLDAPALGCLNLHGSLLPRWRGAAPIQRAVMAGDRQGGVMVMRMEAGLDTGPVALAEAVAIGPDTTAGELHDRLAPVGADLMGRALAALGRGNLHFREQAADGVTYAHKIEKAECRIDWTRPAAAVHDHVRGLSPVPGAWFEADLGTGAVERVKVLRSRLAGDAPAGEPGTIVGPDLAVACGDGRAVRLVTVQRAGKGALDAAAFLNGARLSEGTRLSAT